MVGPHPPSFLILLSALHDNDQQGGPDAVRRLGGHLVEISWLDKAVPKIGGPCCGCPYNEEPYHLGSMIFASSHSYVGPAISRDPLLLS